MELINSTGLVAELVAGLAPEVGSDAKLAALTAKATFTVEPSGEVRIDEQAPYPLYPGDEGTPLGVLPTDLPTRRTSAFEVTMLGAAYAPKAKPIDEGIISVTVGDVTNGILVTGDRRWVEGPDGPVLSPPATFTRMPLTWERAFGGTAEVWLDANSTVEVMHAVNPRGRGFDPTEDLNRMGDRMYVAPGFPRTTYERLAPNLEDPERPITASTDTPHPLCFAPTTQDTGLRMHRLAEAYRARLEADEPVEIDPNLAALRAHPRWVFQRAPLGEVVTIRGCHPEGTIEFRLPSAVPQMDFVLGERTGTRELVPQLLMLLPEERRFYVVYRTFFLMAPDEGEERSARLRFE